MRKPRIFPVLLEAMGLLEPQTLVPERQNQFLRLPYHRPVPQEPILPDLKALQPLRVPREGTVLVQAGIQRLLEAQDLPQSLRALREVIPVNQDHLETLKTALKILLVVTAGQAEQSVLRGDTVALHLVYKVPLDRLELILLVQNKVLDLNLLLKPL